MTCDITKTKLDRSKVLELWAKGLRSKAIAERLGITRWQYVCHIVWQARQEGNPLAVARGKGWAKGKTQDRW